ncbi:nucleotidyltransferase domain-containing protein [Acidobacteria bacterium AH-259-G07]|nr:nucleotidyltransferase domain-containing protein [Acidobacteria bacterium AH-259-G07]
MKALDLAALRPAIAKISRDFALHLVILFGSRSDATAGEESDTDIAVLVDPSREVDATYDLSLQTAFFKVFNTDHLDLVYLDKATPLLRYRAVTKALVLYEKDDCYARYASYVVRYYADTKKFRELERRFIENFAGHGD